MDSPPTAFPLRPSTVNASSALPRAVKEELLDLFAFEDVVASYQHEDDAHYTGPRWCLVRYALPFSDLYLRIGHRDSGNIMSVLLPKSAYWLRGNNHHVWPHPRVSTVSVDGREQEAIWVIGKEDRLLVHLAPAGSPQCMDVIQVTQYLLREAGV